jgi:hypothetical protein
MISPGLYRHYKGPHYRVLFIAKNSTNGADEDRNEVVYVSLSEPGRISVRSEIEFGERVGSDGTDNIYRFTRIGD